jgi:uncharacterized protein YoxC
MNAGQLAALIAAGFFAVLACAGVVVLIKLARLMSAVTRLMTDYSGRADVLLERAQAAVDRTNEQLARTDSITASMDQVTTNMAELSGHVSALAGLARTISVVVTTPVTGLSALIYGVRRAVVVRRSVQAAVLAGSSREPAGRVRGSGVREAAVREAAPRAAITGTAAPVPPPRARMAGRR